MVLYYLSLTVLLMSGGRCVAYPLIRQSAGVRDGMPNAGMPNGENDVLRAECRQLNSTKRML